MLPSIANTQFLRVFLTTFNTPSILSTSCNKNTLRGTYIPLAYFPPAFNCEGPPIFSIYFLTSFKL